MTDIPPPPATGDNAPIDAEFEPAAPRTKAPKQTNRSGPGWLAFGLVGLISIASLGLAAASSGLLPGFKDDADALEPIKTDIAALKVTGDLSQEAVTQLAEDITRLNAFRRNAVNSQRNINQQFEDINGAIEVLEADISAAMGDTPIAAATVATGPELAATEATQTEPADIMETRFSELEARIAALSNAASVETNSADIATIELTAIEEEIGLLRERLDVVEAELAEQPAPAEQTDTNSEDAALALSAIEAAARRGRPFLAAQQKLATALPSNTAAARLEALATDAVPTLADLRASFPDLMSKAIDAEAQAEGGSSSWMRSLFGDGIKVRKKGEVTASDHLLAASEALGERDLETAISRITALDPVVQTVFTDWLDNARKRQTLEDTLEALRLTMIAKDR
jgi:hypothetical protein